MLYMGLDVGEKRIGVAISDPQATMAIPLKTVDRRDTASAIAEIVSLCREYEVERLVVGLPLSMSGEVGRQAESVLSFVEELRRAGALEVSTWDERLSTVAADRMLGESQERTGRGRRRRAERSSLKRWRQDVMEKREHRDAMAATFILQGFLDRNRLAKKEER